MSLADQVLAVNDDLPIRTHQPVHSGKVRSVYWLTPEDSRRLIQEKNYNVQPDAELAIMVISDRISAFDCIWHAEGGLNGVPGKGAALNAISNHWFTLFKQHNLADSHILDIPHPFVWIVQKAKPVKVEAICRQYNLENNLAAFNFQDKADIATYEHMLKAGFTVISDELKQLDQIFVDTKFEFGYVTDANGNEKLIYMDEVGTPDSSRIWDGAAYRNGKIVENSKEDFRQVLLNYFDDPDILLNKDRMDERFALARDNALPQETLMDISRIYIGIAEKITGQKIVLSQNPKQEIIKILNDQYGLID